MLNRSFGFGQLEYRLSFNYYYNVGVASNNEFHEFAERNLTKFGLFAHSFCIPKSEISIDNSISISVVWQKVNRSKLHLCITHGKTTIELICTSGNELQPFHRMKNEGKRMKLVNEEMKQP